MSTTFFAGESPRPPAFTVSKTPPAKGSSKAEQNHQNLQTYVNQRLAEAESDRSLRRLRYASIDRSISTWQKLSLEDSERALLEESTGRQQGLPVNLPLLATHLDDTVAFFTEIFAPQSRPIYSTPEGLESDANVKLLVDRMNSDASYRGYGNQVARTIRSLLKYNCGGFGVNWIPPSDNGLPGNKYHSLDMYNVSWDPVITDMPDISIEGEWVAEYSVATRRSLINNVRAAEYNSDRIDRVLDEAMRNSNYAAGPNTWGMRYVRPPTHIGLTIDGQDTVQIPNADSVNWGAYGLDGRQGSNGSFLPPGGFEKTCIHIWLDPTEFGLAIREVKSYELWKLVFINGILVQSTALLNQEDVEDDEALPLFFGHYTEDDLGEAQRSPMELMRGFQRFGSFLMNIWVLGARKSVYGLTHYDPDMFDPATVKDGQVAGWIPMKRTGRDIRTGLWKDDGKTGVENTIAMLGQTLELVQNFFPSQAAPAQIAGMDRAVRNQITSFLTSAKARLRLSAGTIDSGLFMPVRKQAFRNLVRRGEEKFGGLTDEQVARVLGSGLKTLDSERVEMLMKEILGIVGTSEAVVSRLDIGGMFTTLSRAMNAPFDLGNFVLPPQAPAQPGTGTPPDAGVPQPVPPTTA